MIELWPHAGEIDDLVDRYESDDRARMDGSPWLLLSMISSLDGAASVDGLSGGLGGPTDRAVFAALRGLADVIVVAAGTARAEDYGPPRPTAETRRRRVARGQSPAPRLAIVSGSLSVEPHSRLFTEVAPDGADDPKPIIFTSTGADPGRIAALAEVAELRFAGADSVSLHAVVEALGQDGTGVILAEGGPTLNGQLLAEDLVDELCLTLSPALVGGPSGRIVKSGVETPRSLRLDRVIDGEGLLLLRYVRS